MYRVLACLTVDHDYRLVLLAAFICVVATATAFAIYSRARSNEGNQRLGWLFLTGVATGAGIWATHFVAMLAFDPGLPTAYEPILTVASLLIAVVVTSSGFALASIGAGPLMPAAGGAVIGAGIASMHYTGMRAFQVAGTIDWQMDLVYASVAIGMGFGATALVAFTRTVGRRRVAVGAGLLTLGICGMHFTAMGAVVINPDPSILVYPSGMDNTIMALAVSGVAALVILTGIVAVLIDNRTTRESSARSQELADATIEGLILAFDGVIFNVNRRVCELSGFSREELMGKSIWQGLLNCADDVPGGDEQQRLEAWLTTGEGDAVPVEVVYRPFRTGRKANQVFAIRDLRERRKAEARIHYLAHNDSLTGLPNRATLNQELGRVLRAAGAAGESFAVLCLDLDRFKDVNDVLGHAAGDRVLAEAASRMAMALGEDGYLARAGGDEFVAIQRPVGQPEEAGALAGRLLQAFAETFEVQGQHFRLGVSIGIALYPDNAATTEELLAHADTALYRAKTNGRGQVCFFEQAMDKAQRRRRQLAQAMHAALAGDQFELLYQPQVRIPSSDLIGFEALIRWRHPRLGLVSPADFIPIAEETGLIVAVGEWVLRTACREAAGWERPCTVAVNLSPKQFQQHDLPGSVGRILDETGLEPGRLELEITETALFEDYKRAFETLNQLKALGVSIAMDDFGTGYASLSTLQSFPFDKIKIDRTFVDQIDTRKEAATIVRSVLGLGKSLEIPVLAEGVETDGQLEFLAAEQCQAVQGYYFGKPMPPAQLKGLLRSGSLLRYSIGAGQPATPAAEAAQAGA